MSRQSVVNFENIAVHAVDLIASTYGADVIIKPKALLKFGQNDDVDTTEETVMELQGTETNETFVSTNAITHIISDDDANNQACKLEGHYIDGNGDWIFTVLSVTLNGQTAVALSQALVRATRLYNNSGTDLESGSKVYVYEGGATTSGVPDTASETHIIMNAVEQQSLKASTSLSSIDYGVITSFYASINKKQASTVDVRLKVREYGGVFRTRYLASVASTGTNFFQIPFEPAFVIPPRSDIIITAVAGVNDVSVTAGFNSFLAVVRGS